jgi:hypothetical protein
MRFYTKGDIIGIAVVTFFFGFLVAIPCHTCLKEGWQFLDEKLDSFRLKLYAEDMQSLRESGPRLKQSVEQAHERHLGYEQLFMRLDPKDWRNRERLVAQIKAEQMLETDYRRAYTENARRWNRVNGPTFMLLGSDPIVWQIYRDPDRDLPKETIAPDEIRKLAFQFRLY